jgi:hypothetical protein
VKSKLFTVSSTDANPVIDKEIATLIGESFNDSIDSLLEQVSSYSSDESLETKLIIQYFADREGLLVTLETIFKEGEEFRNAILGMDIVSKLINFTFTKINTLQTLVSDETIIKTEHAGAISTFTNLLTREIKSIGMLLIAISKNDGLTFDELMYIHLTQASNL